MNRQEHLVLAQNKPEILDSKNEPPRVHLRY